MSEGSDLKWHSSPVFWIILVDILLAGAVGAVLTVYPTLHQKYFPVKQEVLENIGKREGYAQCRQTYGNSPNVDLDSAEVTVSLWDWGFWGREDSLWYVNYETTRGQTICRVTTALDIDGQIKSVSLQDTYQIQKPFDF